MENQPTAPIPGTQYTPASPIQGGQTPAQSSPQPSKPNAKKWLWAVVGALLVALVLFFTPIPYYQNDTICTLSLPGDCISAGWKLGPSLFTRILVQQSNSNVSSQPIISQTPSPSPTPDPTANWKTYISPNSFTLSYPAGLYSVESGVRFDGGVPKDILTIVRIEPTKTFLSKIPTPITYTINIGVMNNTDRLSTETPVNLFGNGPVIYYPSDYSKGFNIREISLGKTKAFRVDNTGGLSAVGLGMITDIITIKNNKVYEILVQYTALQGKEDTIDLVEKILQTFKFTE